VVPCAGGSLITKIAKAFKELRLLKLIPEGKTKSTPPQALGCGPIVTNDQEGHGRARARAPEHHRQVAGIGNPPTATTPIVRPRTRAATASMPRTRRSSKDAAPRPHRGHLHGDGGRVTVAAAKKLIEAGRIPRDEPIVICITGNGLKTRTCSTIACPWT